ncbi:SDR family oxidoreductase [Streptosporangium lutulentum]
MADPRAILVTGGAHGIGAAMVRRFTAAGHQVAVADLDRGKGLDLAVQTGCHFVQADVSVLQDNQAAVAETVNRFGARHGLSQRRHPAGQGLGDDFDAEKYHRAMRVNLDGPVYGANAAISHLRHGGGDRAAAPS